MEKLTKNVRPQMSQMSKNVRPQMSLCIIMVVFMFFLNLTNNIKTRACDTEIYNGNILSPPTWEQYEENQSISRKDALVTIMKIIGVDKINAYIAAHSLIEQHPFFDISQHETIDNGYIIISGMYGISAGVSRIVYGSVTVTNFEPERYITYKECLTFMLRCINGAENVHWDTVARDSIEDGLLSAEELRCTDLDASMKYSDFKKLLVKFLETRRYMYWSNEAETNGGSDMLFDLEGSISYGEWYSFLPEIDETYFQKYRCLCET